MKRILFVIALLSVCSGPLAVAKNKSKPQLSIQLYAVDMQSEVTGASFVEAYLIMPDGTRAKAVCGQAMGQASCFPESFAPEKRSPNVCTSPPDRKNFQRCIFQENYPADRDGNNVIVHAANGVVTFHIISTWDLETLTKPPTTMPHPSY
jgi:hypothetical protein